MISFRDVHSLGAVGESHLWNLMLVRSTEDHPNTNISHRVMPKPSAHVEFVRSKPYYLWFLIYIEEQTDPIGAINVTDRNEIGIVLLPAHRGKGYGKEAVQHLLKIYPPLPAIPSKRQGNFVANVNPKNEASIRLFTKLGGVHISNTYKL